MGPGDHLHSMIESWTGESPSASCSCRTWINAMNRNGASWCRKKADLITAKMMREATRRSKSWRAVPVDDEGNIRTYRTRAWKGAFMIPGSKVLLEVFVKQMVLEAIRRSEKDAAQGVL